MARAAIPLAQPQCFASHSAGAVRIFLVWCRVHRTRLICLLTQFNARLRVYLIEFAHNILVWGSTLIDARRHWRAHVQNHSPHTHSPRSFPNSNAWRRGATKIFCIRGLPNSPNGQQWLPKQSERKKREHSRNPSQSRWHRYSNLGWRSILSTIDFNEFPTVLAPRHFESHFECKSFCKYLFV